jgi:diaminopimelate decarboxylase
MSSTYNSRPLAAEVMVRGRQAALVRRRQPVAAMWHGEEIAPWARPANAHAER